ncbi:MULTISPECIES: hypothetical protein [Paenibacillaceae]|uniref:Uncharacterized protein n=2 Tax=Paenibacillaceae TaxID=186822 RepID=A0A938XWG1_9BACL|nr:MULTISPECIES: hypothetical protein [Paenibacillaceae]MBM7591758.1 hypothetical protein [Brevibacillus fulvus]MBN2981567.1 hypothetical protein [Cohnella algarum]
MQIFKLFYTERVMPELNVEFIKGSNPEVFGIQVKPENYREFMNSHYNLLRRYKVQQHIMSNYKFIQLIKSKSRFGIHIGDIKFTEEEDLVQTNNEMYLELRKAISADDFNSVIECLQALDADGYKISRIECFTETGERINVHYNGTISFSSSLETMEPYIKNSLLIDYLVKGPEVLH